MYNYEWSKIEQLLYQNHTHGGALGCKHPLLTQTVALGCNRLQSGSHCTRLTVSNSSDGVYDSNPAATMMAVVPSHPPALMSQASESVMKSTFARISAGAPVRLRRTGCINTGAMDEHDMKKCMPVSVKCTVYLFWVSGVMQTRI